MPNRAGDLRERVIGACGVVCLRVFEPARRLFVQVRPDAAC